MTTGAHSILLVEDDEPTRQAIAMFLRGYHHDVVEAGDAATATEALGTRGGRISSCSTSAFPTKTASCSSGACGVRRRRRS